MIPNVEDILNGTSISDLARCMCQDVPETRISPGLMIFPLARLNFLSMAEDRTLGRLVRLSPQERDSSLQAPLLSPIKNFFRLKRIRPRLEEKEMGNLKVPQVAG